MNIQNVLVVGAGQMGSGIAQVCAQAGYNVILNDIDNEAVEHGMKTIDKFLTRAVDRERITTDQKKSALDNLQTSTDLADGSKVDLVIEAVIEKFDVKKEVFQTLDTIAPKHAIFASNTSSLPITKMAAATNRAEQFIGMHFMNPVPVMHLVVFISVIKTRYETFQACEASMYKISNINV